jgi:hypothetical protein
MVKTRKKQYAKRRTRGRNRRTRGRRHTRPPTRPPKNSGGESQIVPRHPHPLRNAPVFLQLKLCSACDPTNALHFIDLCDFVSHHCPSYWYEAYTFRGWDTSSGGDGDAVSIPTLRTVLESYSDGSIAHLILVTHGQPTQLQVDMDGGLHIMSNAFEDFVQLLRRKLMPTATILLSACLTGRIYGRILPSMQQVFGENMTEQSTNFIHARIEAKEAVKKAIEEKTTPSTQAFELVEIKNWCYPNVANTLSRRLPHHPVYCTLWQQRANELNISSFEGLKGVCIANQAPHIIYVSNRQCMYRYINTVDTCQAAQTPEAITIFEFDCNECVNPTDPVTLDNFIDPATMQKEPLVIVHLPPSSSSSSSPPPYCMQQESFDQLLSMEMRKTPPIRYWLEKEDGGGGTPVGPTVCSIPVPFLLFISLETAQEVRRLVQRAMQANPDGTSDAPKHLKLWATPAGKYPLGSGMHSGAKHGDVETVYTLTNTPGSRPPALNDHSACFQQQGKAACATCAKLIATSIPAMTSQIASTST